MTEVKFISEKNEPDAFNLYNEGKKIGEMIVEIRDGAMTVFHTEVDEDMEGRGFAKQLLQSMVGYVREHDLMVVPMCAYVGAEFKRHPDLYSDIWKRREQ